MLESDKAMLGISSFYIVMALCVLAAFWHSQRRKKLALTPKPQVNVIEMMNYSSQGLDKVPSDTALLLWRLYPTEMGRGYMHPGFIHAHREGEMVFVFMVTKGHPHIIEDTAEMFPSDTLITKIRLIK